ncbi:Hypp2354 [Branchiostoma lanceolatum]|uniref:Hypp2354 protein n=1 Tax=Branchiostoma lanceolatum TaxID=7740 RepID=A0A8K0EPH2_BRALA|nr:Hypp2354 [Branchiostoma lanceolatum]
MGMNLKLLLLLVVAVAVISDEADAQPGHMPPEGFRGLQAVAPDPMGLHADVPPTDKSQLTGSIRHKRIIPTTCGVCVRFKRSREAMGMSLKLLLLLVVAVAIISHDADGRRGRGRGPTGLHVDGNSAEARLPRDLGAGVPQVKNKAEVDLMGGTFAQFPKFLLSCIEEPPLL